MISLELTRKLKECACGCGEMIPAYDAKGRPHNYVQGHNARVNHGMIGVSPPNKKGFIVNRYGYAMIYVPLAERDRHTPKKDGYELFHRYVMENEIARKLGTNEAVHHLNGDKLDNRIDNLELMTHSEHAKLEGKKRPINWDSIEAMRRANKGRVKRK